MLAIFFDLHLNCGLEDAVSVNNYRAGTFSEINL